MKILRKMRIYVTMQRGELMTVREWEVLPLVRQRKLKTAAQNRCELCSGTFPEFILEIHIIDREGEPSTPDNLLILCANCHQIMHSQTISKIQQQKIATDRPVERKKKLTAILMKKSRSYRSEVEYDPAELFQETLNDTTFDLFIIA
jgi:hypothetical protein